MGWDFLGCSASHPFFSTILVLLPPLRVIDNPAAILRACATED